MRIRALVHIAGEGFALSPGDVTDRFSEAEAMRLVSKRAAVTVDPPRIETAEALPPVEVAVEKPERRRKARG